MIRFFISLLVLFPQVALAQTQYTSIGQVLARIITILLEFGGVIAIIGLIVGGYKYITSGGNPEAVEEAKNAVTWSIIGLIIIIIAVVFVRFLMSSLGVDNLGRFGL